MAACTDDTTGESKLYFQDKKSQTFDSYKIDEAYIETQTGCRIKVVHSDRQGEFLSDAMVNHQNQQDTVRELMVHDSPPQNSVSKRGMQTRAKQARPLLISSSLPRFLWEEAMNHSNWLQNHTPACAKKGKTPYELRHKKKPNLAGIQVFGITAYVKDQLQLNRTSYSIQMTYQISLNQLLFKMTHSLRGRAKRSFRLP